MSKQLKVSEPAWYLARWPVDRPLVYLGGSGCYSYLALDFHEVEGSAVLARKFSPKVSRCSETPFTGGVVGCVAYSDYAGAVQKRSRYFQVDDLIAFDHTRQTATRFHRQGSDLDLSFLDTAQPASHSSPGTPLELIPEFGPDHHLGLIGKAIEDIRQGRYYQINLLRYFTVEGDLSYGNLLRRFLQRSGPFGVWVRLPDWELISFSPERFVSVAPDKAGFALLSEPIKGTIASSEDAKERAQLAKTLAASIKDKAELHMIVDLLRNDMYKISQPGSVEVRNPGQVKTFRTIQHLVAAIESRLSPGTTLGALLAALCPGGSITGAPKNEVMKAIKEYERREREFFMGSVFYHNDDDARFDSNILIRTMVRNHHRWQYAAGGGIVIKSSPKAELAEIDEKCKVLTH